MAKRKEGAGKGESWVARVIGFTGGGRWLIYLSIVLSALSSVCSFVPFVAVYLVVADVVAVYPDFAALDAARMAGLGWMALGGVVNLNLNLPRFRLHPYAAILTAPSIFLASSSAGLRLPRAEWIPTLLQRHPMYSKIPSAARSRVSKALACTRPASMRPMSDSIAALSRGGDIDPIEGSMPAPRVVLPSSGETYCEP